MRAAVATIAGAVILAVGVFLGAVTMAAWCGWMLIDNRIPRG